MEPSLSYVPGTVLQTLQITYFNPGTHLWVAVMSHHCRYGELVWRAPMPCARAHSLSDDSDLGLSTLDRSIPLRCNPQEERCHHLPVFVGQGKPASEGYLLPTCKTTFCDGVMRQFPFPLGRKRGGLRFPLTLALKNSPALFFFSKFELRLSSRFSIAITLNKVFLTSLNLLHATGVLTIFMHLLTASFPLPVSVANYTSVYIYTYLWVYSMAVMKIFAFC